MNGKNIPARRISVVWLRLAFAIGLVWTLVVNGAALAHRGPAGGQVGLVETQPRGAAPLKPAWVEALLDARATALQALLEARDLQAAARRPQTARAGVPGAAPLKPEWVEELLDARATALRALLKAHDLVSARY